MNRLRISIVLTLAVLVAAFATSPLPARPAPNIPGSTWVADAKLKSTIAALGQSQRVRGSGTATIQFGPQPGLADSAFLMLVDDGSDVLTFPGSYVLDTKGKIKLTLDRLAAADAFAHVFENVADELGAGAVPDPEVKIKKAKLKAKSKAKNSGDRMTLEMASSWSLKFDTPDRTVRVKMKLSVKGKGPRAP